MIAGGGGGAGGHEGGDSAGRGGCGGGSFGSGGLAHNLVSQGQSGVGATAVAAGAAGGGSATAGAALQGGAGGIRSTNQGSGGGGGGGYWGGGGGAQGGDGTSGQSGWGGGGGVGFLHPALVQNGTLFNGAFQVAANLGDAFHLNSVGEPANPGGIYILFKSRSSFTRPVLSASYSQSSLYGSVAAADATNMQNGILDSTGTGTSSEASAWIRMDLGSQKIVRKIRIGTCTPAIPGGWNKSYTEGLSIRSSVDGTSWTSLFVTPQYSAEGIYEHFVTGAVLARYVEATRNGYVCLTEFLAIGDLTVAP
jgi:hypothetical protein